MFVRRGGLKQDGGEDSQDTRLTREAEEGGAVRTGQLRTISRRMFSAKIISSGYSHKGGLTGVPWMWSYVSSALQHIAYPNPHHSCSHLKRERGKGPSANFLGARERRRLRWRAHYFPSFLPSLPPSRLPSPTVFTLTTHE